MQHTIELVIGGVFVAVCLVVGSILFRFLAPMPGKDRSAIAGYLAGYRESEVRISKMLLGGPFLSFSRSSASQPQRYDDWGRRVSEVAPRPYRVVGRNAAGEERTHEVAVISFGRGGVDSLKEKSGGKWMDVHRR